MENQINSDDIVFVWIVDGGAGGAGSEVGTGIGGMQVQGA